MHIVLALALLALSEYILTKPRWFHSPICLLFLPDGLGLLLISIYKPTKPFQGGLWNWNLSVPLYITVNYNRYLFASQEFSSYYTSHRLYYL